MQAFAIVGDEADRGLERLLPSLEGRVATVRTGTEGSTGDLGDRGRAADGGVAAVRGDTEYVLDEGWHGSGDELSVGDVLERLAPDHDYAAVVGPGADESALPTVVVGASGTVESADDDVSADDESTRIVDVGSADELDVDEAVAAIDDAEPYETLESLVAEVKRSPAAEYAGAIATFTGRVRAREDPEDDRTRYLEFEKYEGVADQRMRQIEDELAERAGVQEVRLHHRTGRVDDGEDIVFVVVLAGHREEAFSTVEDGINRLKDEVPLFKREVTEDETFWVHERDT